MKYAGTIVLYHPIIDEVISNIKSYLDSIDVLYIMDNTPDISNEEHFQFSDKLVYIANYQNLGIAACLDEAASRAINDGYNWLLTMDQDSCFEKIGANVLVEYIEKEVGEINKVGIVSPFHNTVRSDGHIPSGIEEPIIVMTSGNFINLKAFQEIGGFKRWLFIDCVDFDYCLNLLRHGYIIKQINNVVLHHELGETVKKKWFNKIFFVDNHNYIRRYYIVRNRHYIYDEYHVDFPDYCRAEIRCTRKEVVKILLYEKDKFRKVRYMYRGYLAYKKGITGAINESK